MRRTIHFYIITCMTFLLLKCARSDHDDYLQTYLIEQNINNTDNFKICKRIDFDNEIEEVSAKTNAFHFTKITDITKHENPNDKSSGSHCVEDIRTPAHTFSMGLSIESHRRTRELKDSNRHQLFEKRTHKQWCLDKENQRSDIRKTKSRNSIQRDALSENVSMNRVQYDRRRFVAARISSNVRTHLPRVLSTLRDRSVQEKARGITNRLNTRNRNTDRNDINSFQPNIRSIERINKRNEDSRSDERKTMDRSTRQDNKRDKELSVSRRLQVREEAQSGRRDIDHNGQVFERCQIVPFSRKESKSFNTDVDRGRTLILTGRRNSSIRNTDKRIDIHRYDRSSETQSRERNYARNAPRQTATERLGRRQVDERQEIRRMNNERRHENLISRNIQTDSKLQNERSNARDVQANRGDIRRFGTVNKQVTQQSIQEERSISVYKVNRVITRNNHVSERRSSERHERRNTINKNVKRPISNGDKETNHMNVDQVRFRESENRRKQNEHRQKETEHRQGENEHRRMETKHRQGDNEHHRMETSHRQGENKNRLIETKHRKGENEPRQMETKHRQGENESRRMETKHRQGENKHRLIDSKHRQGENEHRVRETGHRHGENEHRLMVTEHRQRENEHRRRETEHRQGENEHRRRETEHHRRENEHRRIEIKHRQGENEHRRIETEYRPRENEHRRRESEHRQGENEHRRRETGHRQRENEHRRRETEHRQGENEHRRMETKHRQGDNEHHRMETSHRQGENKNRLIETKHRKGENEPRQMETKHRQGENESRRMETKHRQGENKHRLIDSKHRQGENEHRVRETGHRQGENEHRLMVTEHRQRENEHRRRETENRQGENEHRRRETEHHRRENEHRRIEIKHRQGENEHRRIETEYRPRENEHRRRESEHRQGENEHRRRETGHRQRENEHRRRETEHRQGENEHRRRETEHRQRETEHRRRETEYRRRENVHHRRENYIDIKYGALLDTERREQYHYNRNIDDGTLKRRLQRRFDKPETTSKVMTEKSREQFRSYQQKRERIVTTDKQRFVRDTMDFRTILQKNEDQNRGIGVSTVWTGYHNIVDQNGITRAIVVGFIGIIGRGFWQKQA